MVKQEHTDPEPLKAVACPFSKCQLKPTRLGVLSSGGDWWVWCKVCGSSGPHGHNENEAITYWNERRYVPPPPREIPPPHPGKIARCFWWAVGWVLTFVLTEGRGR